MRRTAGRFLTSSFWATVKALEGLVSPEHGGRGTRRIYLLNSVFIGLKDGVSSMNYQSQRLIRNRGQGKMAPNNRGDI